MNISVKDLIEGNFSSIIDMRSIEKYNNNHIPGSINVPKLLLIQNPEKYMNKNQTYYLYCQNGQASYKVSEALNKKGYRIINVLGGYEAWILSK